mmetsp:Transcript_44125/g.112624  ORF Transcript_44125/g.112624 Transcript_44125/m.112624 type:complete len:227 (+) Transcript_44125:85-765(+)
MPQQVFAGAWGALAVMTALSTALGWAAPKLVPEYVVHCSAIVLFFVFGLRMTYQAVFWEEPEVSELAEVEAELKQQHLVGGDADVAEAVKGGAQPNGASAAGLKQRSAALKAAAPAAGEKAAAKEKQGLLKSSLCLVLPTIVVEAFLLTFVAEWGDRSQLATIGLAMAGNAYGVCMGGALGHAACTGVAVVGGKQLAKYINERVILAAGAALFLAFGVSAVMEELS